MTRSLISISFFFFSLVAGSLTNDETEPRAIPTVAGILNKILTDFAENGLSVPEINLGEDVGRFSNVKAEALGNFEKVVKPYKTYGFDLKLKAEKIAVNGLYDVKNITLPNLFPIFGNGNFSVELEELDLAMRLEAKLNFLTGRFDSKIQLSKLSLKKSTVKFDNLMDDPSLSDFLNELLSSLIPDLVQALQQIIVKKLEPLVGKIMDKVIECIKKEAVTGKLEECIRNITKIGYDLPDIARYSPVILTSLN